MLVTALVALESVPIWASSIYINWGIGLFPAILLRFVYFERAFSKREAKIVTGIIGFCLFMMVSLVSYRMGTTPNMAPVAVWIFATYAILRYRSAPENPIEADESSAISTVGGSQ